MLLFKLEQNSASILLNKKEAQQCLNVFFDVFLNKPNTSDYELHPKVNLFQCYHFKILFYCIIFVIFN